MEKVIKPVASFIDYNTISANPESYILLGFSNKKCICTIHYDETSWFALYSCVNDCVPEEYNDLDELVEDLSTTNANFEIMCEKVE